MCTSVTHNLGTDTDGAELTLTLPVDPPPQPPTQTTSAGANGGSTSADGASGGGADGQIGRFVALALQQAGKRYVFGAEAAASDPNPRAFDCSELVEWSAARVGISPKVPDGSAAQLAHCKSKGTLISVQQGITTKGALLFMPGHVAISLGNGKTIEAMNPSAGVKQGNANNRGWTAAGRIPGAQGY
jgi:cell wall-associated NlpC family hydrolase